MSTPPSTPPNQPIRPRNEYGAPVRPRRTRAEFESSGDEGDDVSDDYEPPAVARRLQMENVRLDAVRPPPIWQQEAQARYDRIHATLEARSLFYRPAPPHVMTNDMITNDMMTPQLMMARDNLLYEFRHEPAIIARLTQALRSAGIMFE